MPSTTKQSTQSASTAPAAPVLKRRKRTPSVTTPFLAAVVQDVTAPKPQVSATPTVSSVSTASATAPLPATHAASTTSGAVPVVNVSDTAAGAVPVVAIPPPTPDVVGPPPTVTIPSVPRGFVPATREEYRGSYPSQRELAAIPLAIANLQSFTDCPQVLGPLAPEPAAVANALQIGLEWREMRPPADAWDRYITSQNGMAWKAAMNLVNEMRPVFLLAVAKDPDLAVKYAGLARLFDAPKVVAKQAVATKKKNAVTKAATTAAQAAAVTAAVSAATAPAMPKPAITVNT